MRPCDPRQLANMQGMDAGPGGASLASAMREDFGLQPANIHVCRQDEAAPRCRRVRRGGVAVLDRSSLAMTTTYLRRLEGQEDKSWEKVAEAIGV